MRKLIKKYKNPSSAIQDQYGTTLTGPTITAFSKKLKLAPKDLSGLLSNKTTTSFLEKATSRAPVTSGFGAPVKQSGFSKFFSQKDVFADNPNSGVKDLLGNTDETVNAVALALGAKPAETMGGGETAIMGLMGKAGNSLLKSGNPIGMAVGAGLIGLKALNTYGGKKNAEQGTKGIDTGAYTTQTSANAGLRNSLVGTYGKALLGGGAGVLLSKTKFGKKLFGNTKLDNANAMTARTDRSNLLAANVSYQNKQSVLAGQNMAGNVANKNYQQLSGGLDTRMLSAKSGAKINPKKLSSIKKMALRKVKKGQEGTPTDDMQKMALGGKLNVIPEGALHARKNNYEGELAEQVTSKGIPVITYDEDDKITQHAEIEHSEIIFNKETTTQLETWFKEYSETEDSKKKLKLEIECGKFLTEEILENTEDNVGLIDTIE